MPATYEPIATSSPSGVTSVTFSSLGTYTDIVAIVTGIWAAGGSDISVQFNGDTATNYSTIYATGSGTAASQAQNLNDSYIRGSGSSIGSTTIPGFQKWHIFGYREAVRKVVLVETANDKNGSGSVVRACGLWRSTSAITSIKFEATGGVNFANGSMITLYGITKA